MMKLAVKKLTLGLVETNTYIIADQEVSKAVIIDPAWDGHLIAAAVREENWQIEGIWFTHAHFDHIGGYVELLKHTSPHLLTVLHPDDLPLWKMQGGAPFFGIEIESGQAPDYLVSHGQMLQVGRYSFEVRHAPGHTAGHVVFYCAEEKLMFCGDVIFWRSIGRTDLPGGDYRTLISSIHSQILSLPDDVRLLTGHGPETSVGSERQVNPFL